MKEYKILEAKDKDEAEKIMNKMTKDGWDVVTMTYWEKWTIKLLITFVRNNNT